METSWIGELIWTMQKLMGENFMFSGSWGTGLMRNDFAKCLSVIQDQPTPLFLSPGSHSLLPAQPPPLGIIPAPSSVLSPSLLIPS